MEPIDGTARAAPADAAGATLHPDGLALRDVSISMERANLVAVFLLPAVVLVTCLPFWAMYGGAALWEGVSFVFLPWIFFPAFLVAIVVHEGLHGIGFLAAGVPRSAIHFGVDRKTLSPYAGCHVPLTVGAYRTAILLPGLVLGVLPWLYGLATGAGWAVAWGALMIATAGGDGIILWIIRRLPAGTRVLDHPSRVGCHVVREG